MSKNKLELEPIIRVQKYLMSHLTLSLIQAKIYYKHIMHNKKQYFSMFCLSRPFVARRADSYTHCHATIQHISDSLISHYIDSETRKERMYLLVLGWH